MILVDICPVSRNAVDEIAVDSRVRRGFTAVALDASKGVGNNLLRGSPLVEVPTVVVVEAETRVEANALPASSTLVSGRCLTTVCSVADMGLVTVYPVDFVSYSCLVQHSNKRSEF